MRLAQGSKTILEGKIVPVIRASSSKEVLAIAEAIRAGGIKVIEITKRYGLVVCPGALTPAEVITAWESEADIVKIFPCDNVGGAKYIKAIKAPLTQVKLMPTGEVDLTTCADFLKAEADCLGIGSVLIDKKAIKEKKFELISEKATQFLKIVQDIRDSQN